MRTVGDLLRVVRAQGVTLSVTEQRRIRFAGPKMTPELARLIREDREAIIDVLTLESRLHLGWIRCKHQQDPSGRDRFDDHWIALLGEYERAHDVALDQQWSDAA